jgi:hypothetical protein
MHAIEVRRLKPGDKVYASDGGWEHECTVTGVSRHESGRGWVIAYTYTDSEGRTRCGQKNARNVTKL